MSIWNKTNEIVEIMGVRLNVSRCNVKEEKQIDPLIKAIGKLEALEKEKITPWILSETERLYRELLTFILPKISLVDKQKGEKELTVDDLMELGSIELRKILTKTYGRKSEEEVEDPKVQAS